MFCWPSLVFEYAAMATPAIGLFAAGNTQPSSVRAPVLPLIGLVAGMVAINAPVAELNTTIFCTSPAVSVVVPTRPWRPFGPEVPVDAAGAAVGHPGAGTPAAVLQPENPSPALNCLPSFGAPLKTVPEA